MHTVRGYDSVWLLSMSTFLYSFYICFIQNFKGRYRDMHSVVKVAVRHGDMCSAVKFDDCLMYCLILS